MSILRSIYKSEMELICKIYAYMEAYIFVLEAEKVALDVSKGRGGGGGIQIYESYARLSNIVSRSGYKSYEYYRSILFVDLISSAELYFSEIIRSVLLKHPQKAGNIQFSLKDIVRSGSIVSLVEKAAENYIYKLMYESPEDYLSKMCEVLSIEEVGLKPLWSVYIEAKARRDLGVHNNWVCNSSYIRKTACVDGLPIHQIGDRLLPVELDYCGKVAETILEIVRKITAMLVDKFPPDINEERDSVVMWFP